jgi:hypothetical protein
LERAINAPKEETGVCRVGRAPVMLARIKQRLSNHAPHYDPIEFLMLAAGVVFIVFIAFEL